MPIEILAGLVVVGIALGAFMVWMFANSKPSLLVDAKTAAELLIIDYPDAIIGEILITDDQRSALLELNNKDGNLGLIVTMGSKHVTRLMSVGDISAQELNSNDLILRLNDFTLPKVSLNFSNEIDSNKAEQWTSKLINHRIA